MIFARNFIGIYIFYNSFEMKKLLLLLFSIVSTTLFAQIQRDSSITKPDFVKVDTLIDQNEKVLKDTGVKAKKKKVEEIDTLSYAQEYKRDALKFQFGLRGGINFGKFYINETKAKDVNRVTSSGNPQFPIVRDNFLNNTQSVLGYLGGVFIRLSRGSFYFQPEMAYSIKAGKFDILQSNGALFKRVNASYSAIDVPLTFGIRFRQGRVFAGPMLSFPMKYNKDLEETLKVYIANDFKNDLFIRPNFGVNAGIGFDFNHFFIEGRYEKGFANIIDYEIGPRNNPVNFQMNQSQFQLTIGLIK